MSRIEIWQPRYKDDVVLIAQYKVSQDNEIVFTKAKHLNGMKFYVSGQVVKNCPLDNNGKIPCYAVPMDKLERV